MVTVPKLWPDATVVCLASGPSLTRDDALLCWGVARVIAVKDAIGLAPWADALYACGADRSQWWQRHGPGLGGYGGLRYTLDPEAAPWAGVLKATGIEGLETDPSGLRTGQQSGYQAINLAFHLGAKKIVLLGYDMQPAADGTDHFFGDHPHGVKPPWTDLRPFYDSLVAPLQALGIAVVNATRRTALECFPRATLAEALA